MRRHRHTVMDGRVVSFATGFSLLGEGQFGNLYNATGPFEVSASRNAVVIHSAELKTPTDVEQFKHALRVAIDEMGDLKKCDGRPRDDDRGEPREVPT